MLLMKSFMVRLFSLSFLQVVLKFTLLKTRQDRI